MPNRLTKYIGGQIVTANGVTEERQFIVDLDGSETRTADNIYFTQSTIRNSLEITVFTGPSSLTQTQTDVTFTVTGDDGAGFDIDTNLGGETGVLIIGTDVISGTSFTRSILSQNNTGSPRQITFTISPSIGTDPETVLADGLIREITLTQPG